MTKIKVRINTIDKVKIFVSIITKFDVDIDIASENSRYIIDAKSIMGIFSLDLSKDLTLIIHSEDPNFVAEITDAISEFKC